MKIIFVCLFYVCVASSAALSYSHSCLRPFLFVVCSVDTFSFECASASLSSFSASSLSASSSSSPQLPGYLYALQ